MKRVVFIKAHTKKGYNVNDVTTLSDIDAQRMVENGYADYVRVATPAAEPVVEDVPEPQQEPAQEPVAEPAKAPVKKSKPAGKK